MFKTSCLALEHLWELKVREEGRHSQLTEIFFQTSFQTMLRLAAAGIVRKVSPHLDETGLLKLIKLHSCNHLNSNQKHIEGRKELHLC